MSSAFSGRNVVVTGATGELGAAVARQLLDAGASVHVPVRDPGKANPRARAAIVSDLADEAAVAAYYGALPPLWASIHCAGGFAMSRIDDTKMADLKKMLDMNALSAFLCCREAIKSMRGRGGRIVNVSAQAGVEPRRGSGMAAYTVSKPRSPRSRCRSPKRSQGKASGSTRSSVDHGHRSEPPCHAEGRSAKWPKPDEVAATIVFLASPLNTATRAALVPVYGKS
jgi:NAD(P)-dependent dehydrogenase (short-subunit alcohol dehydrogenase family)